MTTNTQPQQQNQVAANPPVFRAVEVQRPTGEPPLTAAFWASHYDKGPHISGKVQYVKDGQTVTRNIKGFFKITDSGDSTIRFSEAGSGQNSYQPVGNAYLTKDKLFRFFPSKNIQNVMPEFMFGGTSALEPIFSEAIGVAYLSPKASNTNQNNQQNTTPTVQQNAEQSQQQEAPSEQTKTDATPTAAQPQSRPAIP
jgi:hypothetical protein